MTTAIIFPGQGSQSPEMITRYAEMPAVANAVAATVAEASAALAEDLSAIIADKNALAQTMNTQPALLATCVGVFRGLQAQHVTAPSDLTNDFFSATVFAGHSLGEYAALVCADALDFSDAVRLVRRRGILMQEAAAGGMAAIIGEAAAVDECCEQARQNGAKIWAVNYNSPQQTVVAGDAESIAACSDWTTRADIKRVLPLSVSIPSHCPLMQSAADALSLELQTIAWRAPSPSVIHNATLQRTPTDVKADANTDTAQTAASIVTALTAQLISPVRWTALVTQLANDGVSRIYECGPGGVLCGLGKRMDNVPMHIPLSSADDINAALSSSR